jgi:nudix-type nucleoside diphosphatase (YffH/AdpP family)
MTRPELRLVHRRPIFSGWNRLDEITVAVDAADGTTVEHKREVIDHGHAVAVLPVDAERRTALLVRQWRAPMIGTDDDPFLLEACAGIIDTGETPEAAMHREAEEELGYRIENLEPVGRVIVSPGCLTETIRLYLATYTAAGKISDGGGLDHEGEEIEVVETALDELFAAARAGEVLDAKTLILVQALMLREPSGRTMP